MSIQPRDLNLRPSCDYMLYWISQSWQDLNNFDIVRTFSECGLHDRNVIMYNACLRQMLGNRVVLDSGEEIVPAQISEEETSSLRIDYNNLYAQLPCRLTRIRIKSTKSAQASENTASTSASSCQWPSHLMWAMPRLQYFSNMTDGAGVSGHKNP